MIDKIEFGRTGHMSTRVVFGAASLSSVSQKVADQTLEVLLRYGVNHIDTAAGYGDAELRIAPWLKREPGRFFLATKGDRRDEKGAREGILRSLDRLGVDHVDLWQIHSIADPIEWDQALSPEGALDAALTAREEGLIKWIGITGHGTQIAATLRRSLERFDFDSVLLPCNYITMQNSYYRENFEALVKTCRERRIAVQTIKSIAHRPWMERDHTRAAGQIRMAEVKAAVDVVSIGAALRHSPSTGPRRAVSRAPVCRRSRKSERSAALDLRVDGLHIGGFYWRARVAPFAAQPRGIR